ncbi:MAG: type II secretion system protein [Candidatus Nomurabacteria bacterium]|nr:type II secretion system protein [Candidatus Nomurabacteria bacterium]
MKYLFKFKSKKSLKGFTLIELMVVIALFSTIMTVAIGALFSAQAVNVKLQQTQIVIDGINLAIEEMVRDIRYGSQFYCTDFAFIQAFPATMPDRQDCLYPTGNTAIVFKPANGLTSLNHPNDRIAFYVSNNAIYKKLLPEGDLNSAPMQVTASDIKINSLFFYVKGTGTSVSSTPDFVQPVITVSIAGVTTKSQTNQVKFTAQTTISSRKIDK